MTMLLIIFTTMLELNLAVVGHVPPPILWWSDANDGDNNIGWAYHPAVMNKTSTLAHVMI